ncbi:MAG: iron ABC transporter permease [archaeon]|nr:iron ABC transporter permease [archaeon]
MRLKKRIPLGATSDEDIAKIYGDYSVFRFKKKLIILILVAVLLVSSLYGLTVGAFPLSIEEVYSILIDCIKDLGSNLDCVEKRVVWNQRLPRLLVAITAGAGLAIAGSAMQSMMKNPLADSYTTGISSGASFGAIVCITLGFAIGSTQTAIVLFAFVFSLLPAMVIILLSTFKKTTATMMILTGIAVMYIFNSMTQYLMLVANNETMAAAYEWTVGTLNKANWDTFPAMAVVVTVGSILLIILSKYLNAMNSGDNYAKTVGINVERMRLITLVLISLISASIVSFTGIIGFIGLVAPHITRIFMGSDNKYLIPASALMGATVMVICDIISKSFGNVAFPIGIVASFVGGPVFLLLIIRQKKEIW